MQDYRGFKNLVGMDVAKIFINNDIVIFEDRFGERVAYCVYGDCCSDSYIQDFIGVRKILENGPVLSVEEEYLEAQDIRYGDIKFYGFKIVTENAVFGDQTSVLSFRNESNGYYGGWIEHVRLYDVDMSKFTQITDDWIAD